MLPKGLAFTSKNKKGPEFLVLSIFIWPLALFFQ